MLHTDILASPFGNVTFVLLFCDAKKNMPPWTCSRRRLHLQLQKMMEVDPPFSFSCRRKLGLHLLHVKMTRTVHDTVSCSFMFMFPAESIHLCLQQPHSALNFDKLQNSITHPVPPAVPMIPMMWRITSCEETGWLEKNRFFCPAGRTFHHFPTRSPSLEVTPSVSFPETLIRLSIAKPQTTLDDL